MKRQVIHISLVGEIYYELKKRADKAHLKLSTWVRQKIMEIIKKEQ